MPLSEDSRALLQLLLGRGKSYADISGLLGIDESEVRERARTALGEVDSSAPAPDAETTDYLLGQSDPIARADLESRLASDPDLAERTDSLKDQLSLLVPGSGASSERPASKPRKSTPARSSETRTDSADGAPERSGFASISPHQRRLIALLVGGLLLAVVVILLVTGVFGGGSDDDEPADGGGASPTVAVLEPVAGQQGSGQVQFGFAGTSFAANVQVSGLKPSPKGKSYAFWLDGSTGSFPFYANPVDESGAISGQITLNEAIICLVASDFFPTMRLSLVDNKKFNEVLEDSNLEKQQNAQLPKFTGKPVLEGAISMPQDAKDTIVPLCNGSTQQSAE